MLTRNYETVYILSPNAPEQRIGDVNARNKQIIESSRGKVLNLDDWGKRKLAYTINKENKGHYFCLTYSADTNCVAELERNMRINEDVFRFLTVRLEEDVDPMEAIAAFKLRQEAHAKREKEKAERDAERGMDRRSHDRFRPGPRVEKMVTEEITETEIDPDLGEE